MTRLQDAPFRRIAGFYDGLVAEHGHDHRSCDYGSRESQYAKFRVIADVGDLAGRSLLDVGCGFADLAPYLAVRFDDVAYTGIDLSPRMIERARELRPELDLRCAGLLDLPDDERFDVVVANGIFYLLGESGEALAREMIATLFRHARRAVAFNSLSTWAPSADPGELHLDPAATLDFCRTLTARVQLRHDYHDRDFTVYLYREEGRCSSRSCNRPTSPGWGTSTASPGPTCTWCSITCRSRSGGSPAATGCGRPRVGAG